MNRLFNSRRVVPDDHPAFDGLPVQHVMLRDLKTRAALHLRGSFRPGRMPLVCLAGYQRNMSDFAALADGFARQGPKDWPIVLIDLPGRGRADDRPANQPYASVTDARDVADCLAALGVGKTIILGQGHGGQVAMALAAEHPLLVGGTILVDAGPVTDSRSIMRLRSNIEHVDTWRGKAIVPGFRRMLAGTYPGLEDAQLDILAQRTHFIDKKGRTQALFDRRLLEPFKDFSLGDVLVAQWPLFECLRCAPLMVLRTQLTDQLRREIFDEMTRRRPDALALTLDGQGSPALFDQKEEVNAVADFVFRASGVKRGRAA